MSETTGTSTLGPFGRAAEEWPARVFRRRLNRWYLGYLVALIGFIVLMALLEQAGVPRAWIGGTFLLAPVAMYAGIGLACRTTNLSEYYVAGRRVPAMYNGMAISADWMSTASFMGLAGTLYVSGQAALAYVLGWTGGFVLLALFIAPYLQRFGRYTIPDFLAERYEGHAPRLIGLAAAVLCSFTYVVAQIYGVGLITSRMTGFSFELGIFVALGGVLVCSFLGGMRAVTWTQVAQYMILLIAFLVPLGWLGLKQAGTPLPQWSVGAQLERLSQLEQQRLADPGEQEVIAALRQEIARYDEKLRDVEAALARERRSATERLQRAREGAASHREVRAAERALWAVPPDAEAARERWTQARADLVERARPLAGMPPHTRAHAGDPAGSAEERQAFESSRANFLALVFCLVAGTAGLPHVLVRFYTASGSAEARRSVTWAAFFVALLYLSAPALAVLIKLEIFGSLVGTHFADLPPWLAQWSKVAPNLVSATDINGDGVLQLGELRVSADVLVLAAPEIGAMPFFVTSLVAAGALAAALSTADGLLLTIANALSHDLYFKVIDREAPAARRVAISKVLLLVVALVAAYVAAQRPANILLLVTPAFAIAASTIFPALLLGIFWRRTNALGVTLGMLAGLAVTVGYMVQGHPTLRAWAGLAGPPQLWFGIQPFSGGVFGVPVAFAVMVAGSLLGPPPGEAAVRLVEQLRRPRA